MPALFHSRRRATAIAVPSALAIIVAGAFVAAPALAASPSASPTLPFPTVCPSGAPGGSAPSASPSNSATPSTSASGTPSPTTSTTPGLAVKKPGGGTTTPSGPATPTAPPSASGGDPASPSPSTTATGSSNGGGFWGWLNGVWTWIIDAPYTGGDNSAVAVDAPLNGSNNTGGGSVVAANAPLRDRGAVPAEAAADSGDSSSPDPAGTLPTCISQPAQTSTPAEGVDAVTTPWVMKTPTLALYGLTFNGVETVNVYDDSAKKYVDEPVLDFTAAKLTIESMVTYSIQSSTGTDNTVYNNAGSGTVTTLTNVHMMTVSLTGSLFGLVPQRYTASNLPPLPEHVDLGDLLPIPVVFTAATVQLAFLSTSSIDVPGFNGAASPGVASPR